MFCDNQCSGVCNGSSEWTEKDGICGMRPASSILDTCMPRTSGATSAYMPKSPGIGKPQDSIHDRQVAQGVPIDEDSDFDKKNSIDSSPREEKVDERGIHPEITDDADGPVCCLLTGPRIDEDEMLKVGQWLCYCLCCGVGYLKETNHPCHFLSTCLCCQQACEMQEVETREGVCGAIQTCCCCTPIYQLPPPEGIPRCMLCSAHFCGIKPTKRPPEHTKPPKKDEDRVSTHSDPYTLYEHVVYEHGMPCYCGCCGCGCQPVFLGCYEAYFKCCCCKYSPALVPPYEEETGLVLGRCLVNAGLCIAQCRYPIKFTGNPVCACCGKRCKQANFHPGRFN